MKKIVTVIVLLLGASKLAEGKEIAVAQDDWMWGFSFLSPVSINDGANSRKSSTGLSTVFGARSVSDCRDRWSLILEGFEFTANQSEPNRINQLRVTGGLPMFRWYYKETRGFSLYAQGGIGLMSLAREVYGTPRSSYIGMMTKLGAGLTAPIIFENLRGTFEWSQVFGPHSLDFSYPSIGLALHFNPAKL